MPENSISINRRFGSGNVQPMQALGILLLFAACFVAGFWPQLEKLLIRWDSGDSSYSYLVVPIFIYLCWEKRQDFKFLEFSWNPWALLGYLLAILFVVIGEFGSVETFVYFGLYLILLATAASLYGGRLRRLWFEFLVLTFVVPLPPFLLQTLTFNLKMFATTFSVKMLRLADISVLQDGNIIDLGIRQLQVVDACSGLRYVLPMFLLALLVGHFYSKGLVRRTVLLLFVLPVTIIVNSFRIFVTGVLSVNGYPELADNFFHDFAGLVLFICAAVVLLLVASLVNKIGPKIAVRDVQKDCGGDGRRMASSAVFIVFYCTLLLGSGWALEKLPSTLVSPARQDFTSFPMEIAGWQGQREYISEDILAELWSDDYVKVTFSRQDRPGQQIYLLIPYYSYQGTRHTAHAPQSCLLGGGWDLSDEVDRNVSISDDQKIVIRTMMLEKGKHNLVAGYFFLGRGRVITSPWMNKFYLLWDAFSQRRTDGALVRVEMVFADNQINDALYNDFDNFIIQLWKILPDYIPG